MKNNKMFVLALVIFSLGVLMLFGSSYSLVNEVVSKESYSFNVANFDVQFLDNTNISLEGIPVTDEEALTNGKVYTFNIKNNGNHDVNYRLDIIENSLNSMQDVIKYSYSLNNVDTKDIYLLKDNFTINQNRTLKKGMMDTYKLRIWLSIDADEIYMNKTFSASISLMATNNEFKYASSVIEYLGNNGSDGVVKLDSNYRYNGDNSLNYLWFNCQNGYSSGEEYCEKWRIIGSFYNTWENGLDNYPSLKIINTESKDKFSFDKDVVSDAYDDSYIMKYANGSYYDLLNSDAKKYILNARWYIGNVHSNTYREALIEEKENYFFANVGLISASDCLYLGSNNWLKENGYLTINKYNQEKVNVVQDNKLSTDDVFKDLTFMPVIYLKPDVSIVSGDGSINNPYEISILYPFNYGVKK